MELAILENEIALGELKVKQDIPVELTEDEKTEHSNKWRTYRERSANLEKHRGRAFSLILGQCTQLLQDKMEQDSDWKAVSTSYDPLTLYRMIEKTILAQTEDQYPFATVYEQEQAFYSFRQETLSNPQWYERFNTRVDIGEAIGVTRQHKVLLEYVAMESHAKAFATLTVAEQEAVRKDTEERYLAYAFLKQSGTQHIKLKSGLRDDFTTGNNNYPKNRQQTLHLLDKYSKTVVPKAPPSEGTAFAHKGGTGDDPKDREPFNKKYWKEKECYNCHKKGHPATHCPASEEDDDKSRASSASVKKLQKDIKDLKKTVRTVNTQLQQVREEDSDLSDSDTEEETSHFQFDALQFTQLDPKYEKRNANLFKQGTKVDLDLREIILLDNQSTMDLICNKELVERTFESSSSMRVLSNGGALIVKRKAMMPGYKKEVWFSERAITNIVCLKNLNQQYRVTYDSYDDLGFVVHRESEGKPDMHFKMHESGLHYYDPRVVNTVAENKKGFTTRQIKGAEVARTLYAKDCQVTVEDVDVANKISGKNIAASKGKTTRKKPNVVARGFVKVPTESLKLGKLKEKTTRKNEVARDFAKVPPALNAGKKIVQRSRDVTPKMDTMINRVNESGSEQPKQLVVKDRHGRLIGGTESNARADNNEIPGVDNRIIGGKDANDRADNNEIPGVDNEDGGNETNARANKDGGNETNARANNNEIPGVDNEIANNNEIPGVDAEEADDVADETEIPGVDPAADDNVELPGVDDADVGRHEEDAGHEAPQNESEINDLDISAPDPYPIETKPPIEVETVDEAEVPAAPEAAAPVVEPVQVPELRRSTRVRPEAFMQGEFYQHEPDVVAAIMTKLSLKAGLKEWGDEAHTTAEYDMKQLHLRNSFKPKHRYELYNNQHKTVLESHKFLKEERDGKIKDQTMADGNKQRDYISKEDASSPTVATESVLLTCIVDAEEERDVAVADIPNALIQTQVEKEKDVVFVNIHGVLVDILVEIAPDVYKSYAKKDKRGVKQLLVQCQSALYGTMLASLLYHRKFVKSLMDIDFEINPYDPCIANKMIDGEQMTICFHVDSTDCKLSHRNSKVVDWMIEWIRNQYESIFEDASVKMIVSSMKQKLNTQSSTETEIVGVDNMTKPLQEAMFRKFRDQIMGVVPAQDPGPGKARPGRAKSSKIDSKLKADRNVGTNKKLKADRNVGTNSRKKADRNIGTLDTNKKKPRKGKSVKLVPPGSKTKGRHHRSVLGEVASASDARTRATDARTAHARNQRT